MKQSEQLQSRVSELEGSLDSTTSNLNKQLATLEETQKMVRFQVLPCALPA